MIIFTDGGNFFFFFKSFTSIFIKRKLAVIVQRLLRYIGDNHAGEIDDTNENIGLTLKY